MHTHGTPGAGLIVVKSPELPVFITVNPAATYRSVDILADRGLGACAGPSGPGGAVMEIKVGRPSLLDSMKDFLGMRRNSTVSSDGFVVSGGRGSIVAGGNIAYAATGKNSRVTINGREPRLPEPGVHLTLPPNCTVELKAAKSAIVFHGDQEMTLEAAAREGLLEVRR
jgi:hypothetical protein